MKKLLFSLCFLTWGLLVSCQQQESITDSLPDSTLLKIAQNTSFKAYLKAERELEIHIVRGAFDLQATYQVFSNNPGLKVCEIDDAKFAKIRGGLLFKKLDCEAAKAAEILKREIPNYPALSDDVARKINAIHDEINDIDWNEEIRRATLSRQKN